MKDVGVVGGVREKWSLGFCTRYGRVGLVGSIGKGDERWRWYRRRMRVSSRFSIVVVWGSVAKRPSSSRVSLMTGGVGLGLRRVIVQFVNLPSSFMA